MALSYSTPILGSIARLGASVLENIEAFGRFSKFCIRTVGGLPATKVWTRSDRLASQLYSVGTLSIPVLLITGAFIGMILALESYLQFKSIGQETRLGGIINVSLCKQLGPVLAAVMLAGRVGCALTAELGSMRVTEQIDAMRAMASDPIKVLVVPRVLACMFAIPGLTLLSNIAGVVGGYVIVVQFYGTDEGLYWRYSDMIVDWFSITNGLIKSVFFGAAIGLIACYKGFNCKPGAEGVGRATTESFVSNFLAIIFINLVLAKVLNDFDLWIIKGGELQSVFR
ncbi:MAG: ABC transporter permease [Planctomycetes bacterium]|nr:ABC transporter permease [Planctomycetota bacterium]